MKRLALWVAVAMAFAFALGPGMAAADDPVVDDSGVAISDPTEVLLAEGIDPNTVDSTTVESCWDDAGPHATITFVGYKTFWSGGAPYELFLDIYVPPISLPGP